MSSQRKRKKGLPLPWERKTRFFGGALGSRSRIFLLGLAGCAAAFLLYRSADARHRRRETFATIAQVHRAVHDFRTEIGRCPRSTAELVRPPHGAGRFLREVPRDGWGHELWVRCPEQQSESAQVVSPGPSGSFFIDDNIM